MKIVGLEPMHRVTAHGHIVTATFDLEVTDGVRLYGLNLVDLPDGTKTVFINRSLSGKRDASFRPDVRTQVVAMAVDHLQRGWR